MGQLGKGQMNIRPWSAGLFDHDDCDYLLMSITTLMMPSSRCSYMS